MTEIINNINHLKTYLGDLEVQTDNLIDNRVKSSAPKNCSKNENNSPGLAKRYPKKRS